jgi:CheY-like chemotaxis protein
MYHAGFFGSEVPFIDDLLLKPIKDTYLKAILSNVLNLRKENQGPNSYRDTTAKSAIVNNKIAEQYPLQILVVEDNLINQKVIRQILKNLGYTAEFANDGEESLIAVKENCPDLILMDIEMPKMNGLDATLEIREFDLKKQPHIIALTAGALVETRDAAYAAGIDNYVTKPIQIEDIREALKQGYLHIHKS